jgi:replicative DNA helicase
MMATANGNPKPKTRQAANEQRLLACLMRRPEIIDDVIQLLPRPSVLILHEHQSIYRAIIAQHEHGKPVVPPSILEWLHDNGQLFYGGGAYLNDTWEMEPTGVHAEYYAGLVRSACLLHQLRSVALHIADDATAETAPGEADCVLSESEQKLLAVGEEFTQGGAVELREAVDETLLRMDERQKRGASGLPTGYADLDEILNGLQPSELILVAARPSVGKTCFALNLFRNITVAHHTPTLFISLEQSRTELVERLLCCEGRADSHPVRSGRAGKQSNELVSGAAERCREAIALIDDTPSQTVGRIAATARRAKRRHGVGAVFIDYGQLITADNRRAPRLEQVTEISRRLKLTARELALPVICLCQVNRTSEDRGDGRPRLADLRESGTWEQDADTVLILFRPRNAVGQPEDNIIGVDVAKQRNGPVGEIILTYLKHYGRFENYAKS